MTFCLQKRHNQGNYIVMKKVAILFFLLFSLGFQVFCQSHDEHVEAIVNSNTTFLQKHMTEEVDLALLDDEDLYDKSEAIEKIKEFFGKLSGFDGFDLKHEGTSKLNHQYYVGDLSFNGETKYRMTFFLKEKSGLMMITQIKVEEF